MSTTPHVNLSSLPASGYIEGVYSILNPQLGTTRAGKSYLKCLLRDASAEVPGRQWTFDENGFDDLTRTGFVRIAGHIQLYNGQPQIILEQLQAAEVTQEQIKSLLPTTARDIDQMFAQVCAILRRLEHPAMRNLAEAYLGDEDLMARFRMAPAAMVLHHAWIGGLLEHTLQLLTLAEAMLPSYPQLNRDLVLMGLFLHDLGKTHELTWEKGFDYTPDGNLVGHVVRGAVWLQVKAAVAGRQTGHRLPTAALRVLQHIVLSHHGSPEHGAARVPSTPEAIFVAQLDNLDAKTAIALAAARREERVPLDDMGAFTEKVWALDTRIYRPDPLKEPEEPGPAEPRPAADERAHPAASDPAPHGRGDGTRAAPAEAGRGEHRPRHGEGGAPPPPRSHEAARPQPPPHSHAPQAQAAGPAPEA
jgi:3'-5' exoribonuclease